MGKIKVENMDTFRDTATILALYDSYATSEPFIKCEYGIRYAAAPSAVECVRVCLCIVCC